jgi:hypothetical protein
MIVANRKPLPEILEMVCNCRRVLVVGCKGCVTVCNAGGLKEVEVLASSLRIARKVQGAPLEVDEHAVERQCDPEYITTVKEKVIGYDAVISMACGVGPQFLAEAYPHQRFFPALNTTFMGGAVAHGIWEERCAGCGTCLIHRFDGLCPVARCAKSLMNGPCGGSNGGQCEIDPSVVCIWDKIVRRQMENGRLDRLCELVLPKDWTTSRHGGPRRRIQEELVK